MKKGLWYSVTLIGIFIVAVAGGDRLFLVPTPPPTVPNDTPIVKRYVSPYISLSPYDRHFREAADSLHWDWKLLAAIGFTESRFDSTAQSEAGARGVMQVLPRTLRQMGVPDSLHMDPHSNIMAASRLLKNLDHIFRRITDLDERTGFILASYNAGIGQVSDAMRLAEKYGHNRYKWENSVDSFLKLKSLPEYYNDELCKNGQFKDWKQTLQFVKKVKNRWRIYEEMQESYNDSIYEILLSDSTIEVNRQL